MRFASHVLALLLGAGCAEGATGAGTPGGGGSGDGGSASPGGGGDGRGGSAQGGDGDGDGGDGTPTSASGGGSGDGGAAPASSSSSTSDASSSAMSSTSSGQADPGTIYFSEYMEGSGNNKALELYNAGSTPIDLGTCQLEFYQNGANTAQQPTLQLDDEMLAAGGVFVVCQSNFGQPANCDQQSASVQHSGDDAVALVCDGSRKDVFGKIGEDPGSEWGSGQTSSVESTLRRKCSVLEGDTDGGDAFDPATEWDGAGPDVFDNLGQYNCP